MPVARWWAEHRKIYFLKQTIYVGVEVYFFYMCLYVYRKERNLPCYDAIVTTTTAEVVDIGANTKWPLVYLFFLHLIFLVRIVIKVLFYVSGRFKKYIPIEKQKCERAL